MELHIDPKKLPQAIRLPPPQDTNKYKTPTHEKIVTAVKGKRLPTDYYKGNLGSIASKKFKKRIKSKKE